MVDSQDTSTTRPGAATLRAATSTDMEKARTLVIEAGLPADGLGDQFGEGYVVAFADGRMAGLGGVERYGARDGLLRSVVVDPQRRGTGLGESIVRDRLAWAERQGMRHVYLLTTTAADWFPRFGFSRIAREDVAQGVRGSREFAEACPASATVMRVELGAAKERKPEKRPPAEPEIEEAGVDSFPASDPPSWTPSHPGTPDRSERPHESEKRRPAR